MIVKINARKIGALLFCIYLVISFNSVPLRVIPQLVRLFIALISVITAFLLLYKNKDIVHNKYRIGLFINFFLLWVYFSFPFFGHPLNINSFTFYFCTLLLILFSKNVYYQTFFYLRKVMIFTSFVSLLIFLLIFLLGPNIPIPSFEMKPISMVHINGGITYKIYFFVVTYIGYNNIFFSWSTITRICGFMSEPGHYGILISFILIGELLIYSKRSKILITAGLLTFSTAFYAILFLMELYIVLIHKSINWKAYLPVILISAFGLILIGSDMRELLWEMSVGRNIDVDKTLDDRTTSYGLYEWNHFKKYASLDRKIFGYGPYELENKGIILVDYRAMIYDTGIMGVFLCLFSYINFFLKRKLKYIILPFSVVLLVLLHRVWMVYVPYTYLLIILINFSFDYYKNIPANKS